MTCTAEFIFHCLSDNGRQWTEREEEEGNGVGEGRREEGEERGGEIGCSHR
jgi:hypothetical protein